MHGQKKNKKKNVKIVNLQITNAKKKKQTKKTKVFCLLTRFAWLALWTVVYQTCV